MRTNFIAFTMRLLVVTTKLLTGEASCAHDGTREAGEARWRQVDRLARAQVDVDAAKTPADERVA